ncbi:PIG-L family deacetylase [Niabella terrae]
MNRWIFVFLASIYTTALQAQAPRQLHAAELLQQIRGLRVLGSVLYIAAHPDDENTRLIAYLANDKRYRTGYLSLTRGDGGQNLIGDEQGIELGLIRTQELLAARRIDGGQQFFSRAFDFGYSKSPEEAFRIWGKEKILSDVVWVIRRFQPDVIITRFPVTGEGGHGHHTASAILANEAFKAAADPKMFPEQLRWVKPWQARRILWNTFNFGGRNTTASDQFQIDVGGFNSLLGRSYGEIAAASRSQHKSQGFGATPSRGISLEYFKTTGGTAPVKDLMDGVEAGWSRLGSQGNRIDQSLQQIEKQFDPLQPAASVPALVAVYQQLNALDPVVGVTRKKADLKELIAQCSGLYMDAWVNQAYAVRSQALDVQLQVNNRQGAAAQLISVSLDGKSISPATDLAPNQNYSDKIQLTIAADHPLTQPYWLRDPMDEGSYHVSDQQLIGRADVEPAFTTRFRVRIAGQDFDFDRPVQYRHTDPVKGEQYQPLIVVPQALVSASPDLLLFNKDQGTLNRQVQVNLLANTGLTGALHPGLTGIDFSPTSASTADGPPAAGEHRNWKLNARDDHEPTEAFTITPEVTAISQGDTSRWQLNLRTIHYDHIPAIRYFYPDYIKGLNMELKTAGRRIAYIKGAGDKLPQILSLMGYQVTELDEPALAKAVLDSFDAIITGVRAYNTNPWLNDYYSKLMAYVQAGGNLIVQYNTNNNLGRLQGRIGPYPFTISRNRITDETAAVRILDPAHQVFNFPNKIGAADFDGWIQERSIYHGSGWDSQLHPLLSMADPGENPDEGSLLVGKYGKGWFTYTGLVFFRELPAGVPGALRLFANLIALNQQ